MQKLKKARLPILGTGLSSNHIKTLLQYRQYYRNLLRNHRQCWYYYYCYISKSITSNSENTSFSVDDTAKAATHEDNSHYCKSDREIFKSLNQAGIQLTVLAMTGSKSTSPRKRTPSTSSLSTDCNGNSKNIERSSSSIRKRVCKACDRCRMKKSKVR